MTMMCCFGTVKDLANVFCLCLYGLRYNNLDDWEPLHRHLSFFRSVILSSFVKVCYCGPSQPNIDSHLYKTLWEFDFIVIALQ